MSSGAVYRKTNLGVAEVGARKLKLNPRVRTMLILIDGAQDEPTVRDEAEKVGAPQNFLEELMRLGLVEQVREAAMMSVPANGPHATGAFERFRSAKDFMNVTIVDAMGIKSFFFTMKLERAGTLDDLRGLRDAYDAAIAKALGEVQAKVFGRRLTQLLA
ncbi:hypothetical protein DSM104443_01750 [Usitatibacter rugosus]|uniref:Uncharacterized protein n=1 Tax=Usitatibacter rugosus TaxID=2732067 RepID=A0A6M4GWF4_9PROT|nr:hypothetical protein [Usitatibacter rugosus]QJR10683.1 hypothetical protein DSM104443_01750 [Usitatibacter rugosus]